MALELAVHRYDSPARHLVLRRRQEQDRRRDFLDLRPRIEIRFGIDLRLAGVSMIEGATAFTRISSFAISSPSAIVSAATPAFATA